MPIYKVQSSTAEYMIRAVVAETAKDAMEKYIKSFDLSKEQQANMSVQFISYELIK